MTSSEPKGLFDLFHESLHDPNMRLQAYKGRLEQRVDKDGIHLRDYSMRQLCEMANVMDGELEWVVIKLYLWAREFGNRGRGYFPSPELHNRFYNA